MHNVLRVSFSIYVFFCPRPKLRFEDNCPVNDKSELYITIKGNGGDRIRHFTKQEKALSKDKRAVQDNRYYNKKSSYNEPFIQGCQRTKGIMY